MITIRNETPEDYKALLRLTYDAFLTLDYPGRRRMDEHYLLHLLRSSPSVIRELTFVAERDGEVVGHILYTHSAISRPDGGETATLTFGPLSVLPQYQRSGIGAALVRHSMDRARELGHGAVLITGVTDYYPKLGFRRAREFGLTLEDGTAPDAFMAYELTDGYLGADGGVARFLAPEYELAETDDAGYAAFHERFRAEFGVE
ncbi:MAG: N-acetyltransferase [Oscillospiraceae bacterium]|jgi:predicted N-acetyltransferase YhbS|nr:N-acetyltransferase [Oscillospiraceae bacterium]